MLCLREPSLGPVFGMKGGAAGGGLAQVVPMEDLNLHFTGDIHAIGAANNLLAAILDASILHGNPHRIDALRVDWKRALDMNDRALRQVALGLGRQANGYPRETGFDITAASEVMAILAVARDLQDLRQRIGRITAAHSTRRRAGDRRGPRRRRGDDRAAQGRDQAEPDPDARGAAVPDARRPVREHRARQLVADRRPDRAEARRLRGHRVGIRLRHGHGEVHRHRLPHRRHVPSAIVLVATVRALKHHGGLDDDPRASATRAWRRSRPARTCAATSASCASFGLPCVVAVNRRPEDTDEEVELVREARARGRRVRRRGQRRVRPGRQGRGGARRGRRRGLRAAERVPLLYEDGSDQGEDRDDRRRVYGAAEVVYYLQAEHKIEPVHRPGPAELPVCMAKTPLSLSADPELIGAPEGFKLPVRDVRAYTGAGWLVPLCGDIQQMPGLGKTPAAFDVDIDAEGRTVGLF